LEPQGDNKIKFKKITRVSDVSILLAALVKSRTPMFLQIRYFFDNEVFLLGASESAILKR
jgi:hypothetical protein